MTPGVHFAGEGEGENTRLARSWSRQGHADWLRLSRDGAVSCGDWVAIRCNQAEQENRVGLHIYCLWQINQSENKHSTDWLVTVSQVPITKKQKNML